MGAWEGRSWEALTAEDEPRIQAYWASYLTAAPPDGESFAELAARAQAFFDEHQTILAGRRWVVVTHIGVIRAVLCRELRLPLAEALRFAPARGSHTQLLIAEAGAVLEQLGERPTPAPAPPRPHGARPRVALSGSAGVGKSTLGAALAQRWGVPFLPEGMRARIEAGLKLHDLDHDQLQSLIEALWDEQAAAEAEAIAQFGGFVADRSSLDYAAFYLHYGFTTDQARIGRFFERLSAHAQSYDAVLLLPYGVLPLVEDGVRSTNPYIQLRYQVTLAGLLRQHLPEERLLIMPPLTVLEARLRWAVSRCTPEDPNPAPTDKTFIHV
jgi:nicotinamide riboside kinase